MLLGIMLGLSGLVVSKVLARADGVPVAGVAASVGDVEATVMASGRIEPDVQVELRPRLPGTIDAIDVDVGDTLSKGERLMAIDDRQYRADVGDRRAQLAMARAELADRQLRVRYLKRKYRRYKRLARSGAVPREQRRRVARDLVAARIERRRARQRIEAARAMLDRALAKLEQTEIRAPRDGVVIDIAVEVGESVVPGMDLSAAPTLVTIAELSALIAEVRVEEADIRHVAVGQRARVYPIGYGEDGIPGTVEFVAPLAKRVADRKTRSFTVRIALDSAPPDLRPGTSCRADIVVRERENVLLAPSRAILRDDEGTHYVVVDDSGVARRRVIQLGVSSDSHQQIVTGLTEGELVITGPYRILSALEDGAHVRTERAH